MKRRDFIRAAVATVAVAALPAVAKFAETGGLGAEMQFMVRRGGVYVRILDGVRVFQDGIDGDTFHGYSMFRDGVWMSRRERRDYIDSLLRRGGGLRLEPVGSQVVRVRHPYTGKEHDVRYVGGVPRWVYPPHGDISALQPCGG